MTSEISACVAADLPELMERFSIWYRHNPRMVETDYFNWQFRDAPHRRLDGEYDFWVLRENGRITGSLGFIGFELRQGETVSSAGWPVAWQCETQLGGGLHLYSKFMQLFDNRLTTRFSETTQRLYEMYNIPFIRTIPRWCAAKDAGAIAAICEMPFGDIDILKESADLLNGVERSDPFKFVDRLDDEAEFRTSHFSDVENGCRRSGLYLNWRYLDIPKHDYRMFCSERGFAVYRTEQIMDHEQSAIRIVEWTFGAEETEQALATLLTDTAELDVALIDFHTTAVAIGKTLEVYGFFPQDRTSQPMPDLFRPVNHSGGYQASVDLPPHRTARKVNFGHWYITAGDSDLERVKL